ncbi:PEP-utilizing enzyme [Rhizobium sp. TRM96647]|uniref:putative PEP-binding protein n=1 Tax=unclassified Rhizobium TaxID=2613769 RepID=UPI0021E92889|nr:MULTISPECIES: putative PEP-binding protein [unclassified Rhizobium]MCV3737182.1 PEP-utilizing enzyme [Rhizobium sp. TRM96647]MCV3759166.1 PEP-utilizing enzyme [Rhizobium sp. TRM96650]
MPEALRLKGQGASPGMARGPAYVMAPEDGRARGVRANGSDAARLAEAVDRAVEDLRELAGRSDLESAAILEFQIEMLRDPALLEPSLERIQRGAEAGAAWAATMDAYVASFEDAEDEHIRARGADMRDIRQQVLRALHGERPPDFPQGSILVGRDIAPSLFLSHDWSRGGGIALFGGSVASHVATLARSRGVPMVVAMSGAEIETGMELVVDGDDGVVAGGRAACASAHVVDRASSLPMPDGRPADEIPLHTADGIRLTLQANIDHPSELRHLSPSGIDGIGLFRTEYLMGTPADLADEERQAEIYAETLAWAGDRPVTIRLLDFGADKPPPGEAIDPSSFLGLRGIRLLLARPGMLRTQVRALLRAAPAGRLRVLLPMVTAPSEVEQTHAVFAEEAARLSARDVAHAMPPLGLMVEVPAAAVMPETFKAEFFSFGTNDLAQYLSASARDNAAVSPLYPAARAAVLRFLEMTVPLVAATGRPVGICGDLAGDPAALPALLSCGFRDFSMAPRRMTLARAALSRLNADGSEARG